MRAQEEDSMQALNAIGNLPIVPIDELGLSDNSIVAKTTWKHLKVTAMSDGYKQESWFQPLRKKEK